MSDDSLKSLLESLQSETGSIPGIDNSESIDVSTLTDEQLQSARDALIEIMQNRMDEMKQVKAIFHAISAYEASSLQSL